MPDPGSIEHLLQVVRAGLEKDVDLARENVTLHNRYLTQLTEFVEFGGLEAHRPGLTVRERADIVRRIKGE